MITFGRSASAIPASHGIASRRRGRLPEAADRGGLCTLENRGRFNGFPEHLDAGIYWFGKNDTSDKATANPSKLYNPNKPTMLFFHGSTSGVLVGQANASASPRHVIPTRAPMEAVNI